MTYHSPALRSSGECVDEAAFKVLAAVALPHQIRPQHDDESTTAEPRAALRQESTQQM
jgi:hypothetical protein